MRTIFSLRLFLLFFFIFTSLNIAIAADAPTRPDDVKRITITELQDLQAGGKRVVIIDTRTPGQWQNAKDKIPGAIRINSQGDLQKLKADIPPDAEIVTYCT
ncbi:MAG: rhodanese-like domain-containing protein [Desulfuromusa sp.]|jgi:hypothetical protein|nr:rhodanese-like domain-containing protein [Desulfuromusa sp.]